MLNYEYPPLGGGGSNACKYILKESAKKNLEVNLVTSSPSNTFETEKIGGVETPGKDSEAVAYFPLDRLPELASRWPDRAMPNWRATAQLSPPASAQQGQPA